LFDASALVTVPLPMIRAATLSGVGDLNVSSASELATGTLSGVGDVRCGVARE
jgi:hypothetical protein